ncbi:hypothetical protein ACIBI9_35395 [Nonomuraea sp. NPDC050451]|uniref:hypothetical protein n=1 Tax=Nonomuraea sp. NPDC050451 TaxID=3364364 RepID=UPI0037A6ED2D
MTQPSPPPPRNYPQQAGRDGDVYDASLYLPGSRSARRLWLRTLLLLVGTLLSGVAVFLTEKVYYPANRPPSVQDVHIGVTYSSHLNCYGACTTWSGTETITYKLPSKVPELANIARTLLRQGWSSAPTPAQFGDTRARSYTRTVNLPQPDTPTSFPVTVTHRIPIPPVVEGRDSLTTIGATEDILQLAEVTDARTPRAGLGDPVRVFFLPEEKSKIVLRHPRLTIESTTPASEPIVISGGREERTIDVSEPDAYDDHAVTVDIRATVLREPTIAAAVSARHTAWIWLVVLALLGLIAAALRRRVDLRLDRLRMPTFAFRKQAPADRPTADSIVATRTRRKRGKKR